MGQVLQVNRRVGQTRWGKCYRLTDGRADTMGQVLQVNRRVGQTRRGRCVAGYQTVGQTRWSKCYKRTDACPVIKNVQTVPDETDV